AGTPRPEWNPDVKQTINLYDSWQRVPDNVAYDHGFKVTDSRCSGKCSFDTLSRMLLTSIRSVKALRACSLSRLHCKVGRSAVGLTCRLFQSPASLPSARNMRGIDITDPTLSAVFLRLPSNGGYLENRCGICLTA